jgi:hypothetical protein
MEDAPEGAASTLSAEEASEGAWASGEPVWVEASAPEGPSPEEGSMTSGLLLESFPESFSSVIIENILH